MAERRQSRRARIEGPIEIRSAQGTSSSTDPIVGQVRNVSLSGVYCAVKEPCPLQLNEEVICSIRVPQEQTRAFPFNRIQGHGWVVRLDRIAVGRRAGESHTDEHLLGVVLAFSPDVTALSTITYSS